MTDPDRHAAAATGARVGPWTARGARRVENRVLLALMCTALAAACFLPFLVHAPNRLLSGQGISLFAVLRQHPRGFVVAVPTLPLLLAPFVRAHRAREVVVFLAASLLFGALAWLAGAHASQIIAADDSGFERVSLGGAFWVLECVCWLALSDATARLHVASAVRVSLGALAVASVVALAASGRLNDLSLFQEYANHREAFQAAFLRHLSIVGMTVVATVAIGVPLGVAAASRQWLRAPLMSLLSIIQTVPSIAMFGLLMVPLALLSTWLPGLASLGIGGIGVAPAVLALFLYSLLPVLRSTVAGLGQVSAAVLESARAMGFSQRQLFWRVQAPLALPVLLRGVRVMAVQTIGLSVVAALIGAGGFGAIVFQGLWSNALDLVLLGVIPVVAMAVVVDAGFTLLLVITERRA